jgi:hypothetical protein
MIDFIEGLRQKLDQEMGPGPGCRNPTAKADSVVSLRQSDNARSVTSVKFCAGQVDNIGWRLRLSYQIIQQIYRRAHYEIITSYLHANGIGASCRRCIPCGMRH